ncbi:nuclear transport factor 2 family protein [Amycolatopsis mongoliensis]|uniref:Nuclear transport factor 2 family protein n=1 Tax=Amycolatopsis mongoliensis TaxID=715475 RepID=A0A9Y2NHR7_9PSEU|nr:nuclear transport factor 2 family protein [Amycolatopsis sp. 4-36]WIY02144.1 nuclear transport factor 2 family protein [Amycolatopsis sp. 4-36]
MGDLRALVFRGAEVARMLRDTVIGYEDGTPRTKHVTTNVALEVSGDTASGRAYAAGRYADRFTRSADGWRFTERRATVDLVGDVGHHLRPRP